MYNEPMTNPEQPRDDSYAIISGDTVEIFGQTFPLEKPRYFEPGKIISFAIESTVISYNNREIPICTRIWLDETGKFHETVIQYGHIYEHKGQFFKIEGGISFYPSGNLESFYLNETTETDFIMDGKKLVFYKGQKVAFYEESGLPKTISLTRPSVFQGKEYNVIEISEAGEIINRYRDKRWDYDYD